MDESSWLFGAIGIAVLAMGAISAWNSSVRRSAILRRVAGDLGLRAGRGLIGKVSGSIGGIDVVIRRGTESGDHRDTLVYTASAPSVSPMEVSAPSVGAMLRRAIGGAPIVTGDASFDEGVVVHGSEVEAMALLDRDTRELLGVAVPRLKLTARDGRITMVTAGGLEAEDVVRHARVLLQVAMRLEKRNPLDGLALAAVKEPNREVRRRCVELLVRRAPSGERRDEALAACLTDVDSRIRLLAAKALATPLAAGVLSKLAVDPTETPAARAEAFEAAARLLSKDEASALAEDALRQHEPELLAAGLRVAAAGRLPLDVSWVVKNVPRTASSSDLVALACAAVAASGDPHAERWLLARLHEAGDIRTAAIRALGEIGTVAAVPPLHAVGGSEAAAAVARIQSRVEGAGSGQLSIAETRHVEGAVSLTDRDSGSLSIVTKKKQTT